LRVVVVVRGGAGAAGGRLVVVWVGRAAPGRLVPVADAATGVVGGGVSETDVPASWPEVSVSGRTSAAGVGCCWGCLGWAMESTRAPVASTAPADDTAVIALTVLVATRRLAGE
jgi:hypothetical protein